MRVISVIGLSFVAMAAQASLVGQWSADGDTVDSVFGNNGVIGGTVGYGAGKSGQAFVFSGGGRVEVASASQYAFGTGDFSVAFWVSISSTLDNSSGMMARDSYNANPYQGWTFNRSDVSGGYGFLARESNLGSADARSSASGFQLNRWYHLAGVRTGRDIRFYVDGVLAASAVEGAAFNMNSSAPMWFGGLQAASTQYFNGSIDDIRLYNSALTNAEVENLAGVPEPMSVIGLLGLGAVALRRKRQK